VLESSYALQAEIRAIACAAIDVKAGLSAIISGANDHAVFDKP